jgi:hypothetical protein
VVALAVVATGVVVLWWMGRVWWCVERDPTFFVAEVGSAHNSQHVFDWYSFSHLLHGVVFFWALWLVWRKWPTFKRWALPAAVAIETAWEVLENSPIVIDRYRQTMASGYEGDSIVNSVGDIGFCVAGFYLARLLGWKLSLALFAVLELVMLWFIRDNLTLNVVMLAYPFEFIKNWQTGM